MDEEAKEYERGCSVGERGVFMDTQALSCACICVCIVCVLFS